MTQGPEVGGLGEALSSSQDGVGVSPLDSLDSLTGRAAQTALMLEDLPAGLRSAGLREMAAAMAAAQDEILEANTLDLEASQEMAVPGLLQEWLKLTPERLQGAICILRDLAEWPDPMQQVGAASYQPERGQAYTQRSPLGVVVLLSEAFPELAAIAAALCLRTANALMLRGGSEASHSNAIIVDVLREALEKAGLPADSLLLVPGEVGSLSDLLNQNHDLDLVIPYGRPSWLQQVVRQSVIPVLPTAMGNCYLYWGSSAPLETVRWMIIDSHRGEPDAVNAIEKVLLPPGISEASLQMLWNDLLERGFELRADAGLVESFSSLTLAKDEEWDRPYLSPTIAFRTVNGLSEAITWINRHSSGHGDCLATDAYGESRQFTLGLRSAMVYVNASPRFQRRPSNGGEIALGMCNVTGARTGRIGLDALTQMTQIVLGQKK